MSKAHRSLDANVALEVTSAGAENQLLLQAGFVEPDDFVAFVRPADVVVSVLTPAVLKLQGHPGVRGEKLCRSLQKCRASCKFASCGRLILAPPNHTSPLTSVHQGSQPFLPKPENSRRRTKPEKVRRF